MDQRILRCGDGVEANTCSTAGLEDVSLPGRSRRIREKTASRREGNEGSNRWALERTSQELDRAAFRATLVAEYAILRSRRPVIYTSEEREIC